MNKGFKVLLWMVFVSTMWLVLSYQHELTHKQINSYFGINSTIVFEWEKFATVPDNTTVSEEDYRTILSLHSLNEIVGYQYDAIFLMTALILLFVVLKP